MVYIQKGIQILSNQFDEVDLASGYCSVMIALLMVICGVGSSILETTYIISNHGLEKYSQIMVS